MARIGVRQENVEALSSALRQARSESSDVFMNLDKAAADVANMSGIAAQSSQEFKDKGQKVRAEYDELMTFLNNTLGRFNTGVLDIDKTAGMGIHSLL